jgi:glutaredoxin-like protein NrdH
MVEPKHVEGRQPAHFLVYTLTTCGWCKKTKALMQELGVGYDYVDVDTLDQADIQALRPEIEKWNPACSFPTIVVDGSECIVGYDEDRIRELAAE